MIMKNDNLNNSTQSNYIASTWDNITEELLHQTEYRLIECIDLLFILFFNYIDVKKENNLILTNDIFTRQTYNLART